LNIAQWGRGVYGVGEAAERYFGVPAAKLTAGQSALLAATLPSPSSRNPADPGARLWGLAKRVDARAAALGPAADCVLG
jgi:monofunctional glycosyltransferase